MSYYNKVATKLGGGGTYEGIVMSYPSLILVVVGVVKTIMQIPSLFFFVFRVVLLDNKLQDTLYFVGKNNSILTLE